MKNYKEFKHNITEAIYELARAGMVALPKKWAKQSPFQKARYKPEYVFPEVWLYTARGGAGAVITGEEIAGKSVKEIAQIIKDYLF